MLGRLLGKYSIKSQPGQRPLIQRDRYQYDAAGQLITARNAHARVVLHHDAMGNLLEEQLYQRGRGLSQLRHEYDELGNRLRTHLPDGRQLDTLRYGSGHVFAMELDGASLCDMERDSLHREISRSQGALRSRYQWDALGRLLSSRTEHQHQHQPLVGEPNSQGQQIARSYQYDAAGQLTAISDTRKGLTRYGYDELGRLLSAAHPFAVNEVFAFDPAHNLISQQQAEHNQQKRQTGNRWSEEEWQAYVKANAHRADFDPWLTPEQVENDPRFWGEARPNRLTTWQDHRYQYDHFGNCIEKISGSINNSTQQKLEWDAEHRLSRVWIERTHNGKTTREGWGYDYDPFGRRLAKYPLDAAENKQKLQQQFSPWKSPQATYYGWDGHQLISEQQQNKHQLYIYEPDSFVPLALVSSEINAKNQRTDELVEVLKDYPLEWQQLQHQYPEHWAQVLEQQRKYRKKAGVTELKPKAKTPENQQVYYYHTDHLGTPQELTDQDGDIVWSAHYQAWGRVHSIERPQKLTYSQHGNTVTESWVAAEQIEQPLRFQGQYHDSETGLHYNRYRYYDPDIGRFISQDPIGLLGGINLYQYAPNPVGWVDPLGLCPKKLSDNMENAGQKRPEDAAAHHIVGDTSKAAQPARDILKKHGIDVDDAVNGVFLPNRNNIDKAMTGILHNGRHPDRYLDKVNELIKDADKLGGRPAVIDQLNEIGSVLRSASRDAGWRTVLDKL